MATCKIVKRVNKKKRPYSFCYKCGIYLIVIVSIAHVIVTTVIKEKKDFTFDQFKAWWTFDLILFLVKASLHLYSVFLILKSTRIMQRIA